MSPGEPPAPADEVLHGVDFSGGRRQRRKVWISSLLPGEAASARGGSTHAELLEAIARSGDDGRRHHWLIDSAFGLPLETLALHGVEPRWRASIEWLASFASAREWRRALRARSRKELWRAADRAARTPLPPANLRLFRQTWHCMVSLLLPLCERPGVAVLPFAAAGTDPATPPGGWRAARVRVGEGCPSSSLRLAGWPHQGYKGNSEANLALRRELLRRLQVEEGIAVEPESATRALEDAEGDVLDSLLLLPAARRFARGDPAAPLGAEPRAAVEGWVYL